MTSTAPLLKAMPAVMAVLAAACAQPQARPVTEPPPVRAGAAAQEARAPVVLRPGHPERYLVQPGDTLVDVAELFLERPWQWAALWSPDPSRSDPNAIYPGEVVELYYDEDGQPRLRVIASEEVPIIKLSPQIRVETLVQPIPVVPRSSIESFIKESIVVSEDEWEEAPYIVSGAEGRFIMGIGDPVYARGVGNFDQSRFRVFRPGEQFRDPQTGRSLGYNGILVAKAELEESGEPALLVLTDTRSDVRRGDRLFPPAEEAESFAFAPKPAPPDTEGQLIALLGDTLLASQYQSVVVNLGLEEGMEPGYVLGIYKEGRIIEDPLTDSEVGVSSEHRVGLVMLYKVYDQVSYGLIMEMGGPIRLSDRVATPEL